MTTQEVLEAGTLLISNLNPSQATLKSFLRRETGSL